MIQLRAYYDKIVQRIRAFTLTPRTRNIGIVIVVALLLAVCIGLIIGGCNPFPPAEPTPTPTDAPTITPPPSLTPTLFPTRTLTPTIANTKTATFTPTNTATNTPTLMPTFTLTIAPTETDMPTVTPINTITPGRPVVLPDTGGGYELYQKWIHRGGK